jgi:hypothetical protein
MINPLRQFICIALTLILLSANGLLFVPLLERNQQSDKETVSMQNCCCCKSGGETSFKCSCASRHSSGNDRSTCSIASAPCAAPTAALSPNVLDQWTNPGILLSGIIFNRTSVKYPGAAESLLSGKQNSLFHPPQSSFSLFFLS